jgi:prepilin peptidase CpaA
MAPETIDILLCATLIIALVIDLKTRRIPNALTLPAMLLGILFAASWKEAAMRAGLVVLVLGGGYLLFAVGIIGAGDVKLAAAVASLKGWDFLVTTLIGAAIVGLFVAIFALAKRGDLFPFMRRIGGAVRDVALRGIAPGPILGADKQTIPYAVVLAGGAFLALVGQYRHITPLLLFQP